MYKNSMNIGFVRPVFFQFTVRLSRCPSKYATIYLAIALTLLVSTLCLSSFAESEGQGEEIRNIRKKLDEVIHAPTEELFLLQWFKFLHKNYGLVHTINKGGVYPIGQSVFLKTDSERKSWHLEAPSQKSELLPNGAFVRLIPHRKTQSKSSCEQNTENSLVIVGSNSRIYIIDNTKDELMVIPRVQKKGGA